MAQHQNTWRDFSQIGLFAYKWENNAKMVMFYALSSRFSGSLALMTVAATYNKVCWRCIAICCSLIWRRPIICLSPACMTVRGKHRIALPMPESEKYCLAEC